MVVSKGYQVLYVEIVVEKSLRLRGFNRDVKYGSVVSAG